MQSGEQQGFSTTTVHHSSPRTEAAKRAEVYITCEERKGTQLCRHMGQTGAGSRGSPLDKGEGSGQPSPLGRAPIALPRRSQLCLRGGGWEGVPILLHPFPCKLFYFSAPCTSSLGNRSKVPVKRPSPPRTPGRSGTIPAQPGRVEGAILTLLLCPDQCTMAWL